MRMPPLLWLGLAGALIVAGGGAADAKFRCGRPSKCPDAGTSGFPEGF